VPAVHFLSGAWRIQCDGLVRRGGDLPVLPSLGGDLFWGQGVGKTPRTCAGDSEKVLATSDLRSESSRFSAIKSLTHFRMAGDPGPARVVDYAIHSIHFRR